jgi:hypothetical protein
MAPVVDHTGESSALLLRRPPAVKQGAIREPRDHRGPGSYPELRVDASQISGHGPFGKVQVEGNVFVDPSLGD